MSYLGNLLASQMNLAECELHQACITLLGALIKSWPMDDQWPNVSSLTERIITANYWPLISTRKEPKDTQNSSLPLILVSCPLSFMNGHLQKKKKKSQQLFNAVPCMGKEKPVAL